MPQDASGQALPADKDSKSFKVHQERPLNAEPDVKVLVDTGVAATSSSSNKPESWTTSVRHQYLRNHGDILHLSKEGYRLHIDVEPGIQSHLDGDAPLSRSVTEGSIELEKLLAIGRVDLAAALQCAGNRREEMNERGEVEGILWGPGTILNAEWEGVPLRCLLRQLGVPDSFQRDPSLANAHCHFFCPQRCEQAESYEASIPLADAMDEARCVLLADTMNKEALPDEHGGPVRIIVPGFIGARSVKWLHTLRIKSEPSTNFYMTSDYKKLPSKVGSKEKDEWMGKIDPLQETGLQSSIGKAVLDAKGRLSVTGYAYNGRGTPIKRVQVCVVQDDAQLSHEQLVLKAKAAPDWEDASLEQEHKQSGEKVWSWTLFATELLVSEDETKKPLAVLCRAESEDGEMQEGVSAWNIRGVLNQGYGVERNITSA